MTAVVAVPKSDCVDVLTDGAFCDAATGKMVGTGNKVWLLPKQNAVLVITGSAMPGASLQDILALNTESFDELEERAPYILKNSYEFFVNQSKIQMPFYALFSGISALHGPRIFGVGSHDLATAYHEPWLSVDHAPIFAAPGYPGIAGLDLDTFDPAAWSPDVDGIRLMEAQRKMLQQVPQGHPGDMHATVGGFVQHTRVSAEGISTRIIHRWPDRKGERIAVSGSVPAVPATAAGWRAA